MLWRAPLHCWADLLKRPEFAGSRIQQFTTGYSPGVWVYSDTRFAYRWLPAFRSSSSSAMRTTIRVDKQECLKPYSSNLAVTNDAH
jgi:hypothetical protein